MKIEAFTRLRAMSITKGNNYPDVEKDIENILYEEASRFKILNFHKKQILLSVKFHGTIYLLATMDAGIEEFREDRKTGYLTDCAKSVDAFIHLNAKGVVEGIWVAKKIRGKGYGKVLYRVAHENSTAGISSSRDLSESSLATWLSLYKEENINLIWNKRKINRKDVVIKGLSLKVRGKELTAPNEPAFYFVWPKA